MEMAVVYGGAVMLFIWSLYSYLGYRNEKRKITKKYEKLFEVDKKRNSLISTVGDRFDSTPFAEKFKIKLVKANLPLLPSEFFAVLIFCFFATAMLLNRFFDMSMTVSVILAVIVCVGAYFGIFLLRKNKNIELMNNQLSDVCRLLSNSTRAGMTINQGLEVVASEIKSPAKEEFKELAHNLRLGVDFERAVKDLEKRVPTREFKLFTAALLIQKRSGGNLTKALEEMAQTLEERKILRQTVKTATAEQRFISYILPVMPIVLILMLNTMLDGFLDSLFTIPGAILGLIFIIGMTVSFILVRAVTNIRV